MSIIDRLNLLVRANLNESIGSGRSDSARSTFNDMESSIRDARRELAQVRVGERQIIDLLRQERERAEKWEDRAMLALRHGDEDLAREALVAKNRSVRELERLRDQLDGQRGHIRDIEKALEALEMKLDGARGRVQARGGATAGGGVREERDWDAEMRRRLDRRDDAPPRQDNPPRERSYDGWASSSSSTGSSSSSYRPSSGGHFDTDEAFGHIDRIESKISHIEAQVDAARALSSSADDELMDPRKVELERIFGDMEKKKRESDDLSDLKKRFSDD